MGSKHTGRKPLILVVLASWRIKYHLYIGGAWKGSFILRDLTLQMAIWIQNIFSYHLAMCWSLPKMCPFRYPHAWFYNAISCPLLYFPRKLSSDMPTLEVVKWTKAGNKPSLLYGSCLTAHTPWDCRAFCIQEYVYNPQILWTIWHWYPQGLGANPVSLFQFPILITNPMRPTTSITANQ